MDEIRDLGRRAFLWGLPSIDLYRILRNFALDPQSPEFKAPLNRLFHSRRLADPSDRSIVAMNVDTLYSYAWLDLRTEPIVLTIPPFDADRYVSAQIIDLYTYIVGYISPRTNGHVGGQFLLAGPDWTGDTPVGMPVFRCPTQLCLVLVRSQLFDDADLSRVAAIQDAMAVQPLSALRGALPPPAPAPLAPIAPVDVRAVPSAAAFGVLAWMLRLMPVLPQDAALRGALAARLGVHGDGTGHLLGTAEAAVRDGIADALADITAYARTVRSSGELFGSREFFAGNDLARATGAFLGILGNSAEEYLGVGYQADADGQPFDGSRRYRITFPPGGLPPVGAFWSITVYNAHRVLYANEINRYVIRRRDVAGMRRDPDGGLTIDVQHDPVAPKRLENWLPCPAEAFNLAFRTYLPGEAIRTGSWTAPPVVPTTFQIGGAAADEGRRSPCDE